MSAPVVHLVSFPNQGHNLSPKAEDAHECWCEPQASWVKNKWGIWIRVIDHNDYAGAHADELAWIDHALYSPNTYPAAPHRDIKARNFPSLPPHDEKGPDQCP